MFESFSPTPPASSMSLTDTIAAISTPPGRGGIGIVRLSGPDALLIAAQLLQLTRPPEHARARPARVLDPLNPAHTIDDAILTVFLAPRSYTGENTAEIAAHGSPVILDALLRSALAHGARLASAGEFTQRAFLSGRLDLTQAEAVHDLIAAQTLDQARVAAQQLGGALSRRIAPAKESLLYLIALLEAGMDFASGELDDVDIVPPSRIAASIADVQQPLAALAASFRRGQLLRNGAAIALIGPPNAGKSSLFNRLLERDRAIITPLPGTTRDTLEESLSLAGIPLRLIDTAGLRSPTPSNELPSIDLAEQQGIARSHEALADADLILLIHDATQPLTPAEIHLSATLTHRPHLLLYNKIDLLKQNQPNLPNQNKRNLPNQTHPNLPNQNEPNFPNQNEPNFPQQTHPVLPNQIQPDLPNQIQPNLRQSIQPNLREQNEPDLLQQTHPNLPNQNKRNLPQQTHPDLPNQNEPVLPQEGFVDWAQSDQGPNPPAVLRTSALTGDGIDDLRTAILAHLGASGSLADAGSLNNLRQQEAVTTALAALAAALAANAAALPHELILLDLHTALRSLDSLTGTTTPDDILARIFSTFCIGK
jgi:tRNA modification GTPase